MTKLNLDRLEADRKAGTPGEWLVRYDQGSTQLVMPDHPDMQCQMCDETYYPWVPDNVADWERIARVPQLEAMVSDMAFLLQEVAAPNWQAVEPSAISRSELPEEWQEYIEEMETHFCAWQISSRAVLAKHVGEAPS